MILIEPPKELLSAELICFIVELVEPVVEPVAKEGTCGPKFPSPPPKALEALLA